MNILEKLNNQISLNQSLVNLLNVEWKKNEDFVSSVDDIKINSGLSVGFKWGDERELYLSVNQCNFQKVTERDLFKSLKDEDRNIEIAQQLKSAIQRLTEKLQEYNETISNSETAFISVFKD